MKLVSIKMSDHPDVNTVLLAKESRRNYGSNNIHDHAVDSCDDDDGVSYDDEDDQEHKPTSSSNGVEREEIVVDYNDIEFGLSWRYLNLYLIEPLVFILLFSYNLSSTILKNQIIYQTCTSIFLHSDSECKLLGTRNATNITKAIETEVQPYAARIFMSSVLIESLIPAIFGVFIGAWSDRFGRKPLLLAAFIGYVCFYTICCGISYVSTLHDVSPWYYLLASLPHTLLGGSVTYTVAAFCFISDVSSARERPYRMVFYEAALHGGLMSGSLAAGYIYEATNSTVVFAISALSLIFAFLIIAIFLPESLHYRLRYVFGEDRIAEASARVDQPNDHRQFFNVKRLKEMWLTCFKPRAFHDRCVLWLIIITTLITVFIINGSMTVFYLFIREQFHWSVREFTTFETVSILASVLGNLVGVWLLRKMLKVSLLKVAMIALVSQAACSLMKGFAFLDWHLYFAVALGSLRSLCPPMARAIISNIAPAHELGKIFAFQSVLQTLIPFLATPIYTFIYSVSLASFPGFFNVMSANLFLIGIALLLVILRKRYQYPEHYDDILN